MIPFLKPERLADGDWQDVAVHGDVVTFDASAKVRQIWHDFHAVQGRELAIRARLRISSAVKGGYTKLVLINGRDPDHQLIISDVSGELQAALESSSNQRLCPAVPWPGGYDEFVEVELSLRDGRLQAKVAGKVTAEVPYQPQLPCSVALNAGGWKCDFESPVVVFPEALGTVSGDRTE